MASSSVNDKKMRQQLFGAASSGNLRHFKHTMVESLNNKEKDIAETVKGIRCPDGLCALHYAAIRGNTDICPYLIDELGIPVDFRSDDGKTPLLCAAINGRSVTVKYLIGKGADPTTTDKECSTPLLYAAESGHTDVVKILLSRGVPVDTENHRGTPLHQAASHGQENVMKILLEHGADINKLTNGLMTPLHCCIMARSLKHTKLLIEAKADVNLACPLVMAVFLNDIEMVKCLLEAGADPNIPNEDEQLPIEVAAINDRKGIVKFLFPLTSPIPQVKCWSIEGLYIHVSSDAFKKKSEEVMHKKLADHKMKGDEAFKRKDFLTAVLFYNGAVSMDPKNAKHLANRSLCYLKAGFGEHALQDAFLAQALRPDWPKAWYRVGAALMLLKDYKTASRAFRDGLDLDPTNEDMSKALQNALDCMRRSEQ